MSDQTTRTEQDEFYDDATDQFAGKEDLKDRLVAVWVTGKKGTRKSTDGKDYAWVETTTLVLDDGPTGDSAETAVRDGEVGENRVGPAPALLENFQWSTNGMTSRLIPRIGKVDPTTGERNFKPMIGRINSQPNKVKGRSASWSISAPTDSDRNTVRANAEQLKAVTEQIKKAALGAVADEATANAFDE